MSRGSSSGSEGGFVHVDMDRAELPFFASRPPPARRKTNIFRLWTSLSRFQRSLLSVVLLVSICSCTFLLLSYARFRATTEPQHRKTPPSLTGDEEGSPDTVDVEVGRKTAAPIPVPIRVVSVRLTPQTDEARHLPDQVAQPKRPQFKGPQNERQKAVVAAFQHAWNGYKKYAWGRDHLKPISRSYQEWYGLGLTIVDSLDTLLIMGLNAEFKEALNWVRDNLNFELNKFVNLFETTIRVLGGLLSAFHLSGETVLLDKAKDLGQRLAGAFQTTSRIPYCDVNLKSGKGKLAGWGGDSSLAEVSTIQLEFRELSRKTGMTLFEGLAFNVSQHIHKLGCEKMEGLCPMFLNPKTGQWKSGYTITLGARSDSYYEYLLKQWLQTGKTIPWLKADYEKAIESMSKRLVRYSEPNKLTFIGELISEKTYSPKMDHLVCYLAGTLALGTVNGLPQDHMDLAKQLAHTCHEMYRNPTGLGPEIAHFNMIPTPNKQDMFIKPLDAHCLLRPEAIEGWFYLYRLTGDKQYQEWGWEAFQAMEKFAKVPSGYSSVSNVKKVPVQHRDMMESFFLAETLKYLYLLFADEELLPFDEFVFNSEAHPLPVYRS